MAKRVKKELTDDAKAVMIGRRAVQLGLDPQEISAALTEKYGPYAYDIMEAAVMRPSVLMSKVGGKAANSRAAVEYFLKYNVSNEGLARAFGTNAATIEANIAAYRAGHPRAEETPEQREAKELKEHFNQHFNEEMNRRNNGAELTVDPAHVDISRMTLDDYAKYCNPEDRPAENYDDLLEKAYEDFGKGEGIVQGLYLDSKGYPTIGNGHLVLHPDYLKNPAQFNAARDAYVAIPLVGANGKPLTPEQKKMQFGLIANAMRNGTFRTSGGCPNYVKIPATGKLNDAGIKYLFKQDFRYAYNQTKKVVPNIDKMPLPVQLATLHCTFAYGNASRLSKVDVNDPAAVMQQVDILRNRRGISMGERNTIKEGNDSIRSAQNNYIQMRRQPLLNEEAFIVSDEDNSRIILSMNDLGR